MKLFKRLTRNLSAGLALVALSHPIFGQGEAYPVPMPDPSSSMSYPTYATEMSGQSGPYGMASDGYSEASCDGLGFCGDGGGLLGGGRGWRGDSGGLMRDGCGLLGGGQRGNQMGDGYGCGNRCGPLGCDGGTFGDGRSLSDLFGPCASHLCGLTSSLFGPYGEGGVASQRWFDVYAGTMVLRQDHGAGSRNFSSQGLAPINPSDFVLSTSNVDFDQYQAGLALQANLQVGPGSNVEVIYFGLNKWRESASVTSSTPTLYSFFSDFGTNPFDGFDDSDRSVQHSLNYESALNNGEVNLRRRWAEPSGFLQGSCLAGIRYFQLDEEFLFSARGTLNNTVNQNQLRFFDYLTQTRNQMTGFQIGSDVWLNVIPGIKIGAELKGGIFGNHATQTTRIVANSLPAFGIPSIDERASDGRTAYLVQFSPQAIYRLTYSLTLHGSYQVIYVDNVALAPENVNDDPPALFLPNSIRTVRINTDGEILYTGFTAGVEYTW